MDNNNTQSLFSQSPESLQDHFMSGRNRLSVTVALSLNISWTGQNSGATVNGGNGKRKRKVETEIGNGKRKREMVVTAIRTQYKLSMPG